MIKKLGLTALCTAMLLVTVFTVSGWAGWKWPYPVYINTVMQSANGAVGSVRNSSDPNEYISCNLSTSGSGHMVNCYALDAGGTFVTCASSAANMVTVMSAMTSASNISFGYDNAGNCTSLQVSTASYWEPPVP